MAIWIKDGALIASQSVTSTETRDSRQLLTQSGAVKVELADAGTVIQWSMGQPNWSSLFFALTFIRACPEPFRLHYFNKGWFQETLPSYAEAAARIEQLVSKADVHLFQRTYTRDVTAEPNRLSPALRHRAEAGVIDEAEIVRCRIDLDRELSFVETVGEKTDLRRMWGPSPVAFPCLSGNSYDRIVSKPYFDAVQRGRPVYDHVLATMAMPDGEQRWIGYHRAIIPEKRRLGSLAHVKVLTEVLPVDIKLI